MADLSDVNEALKTLCADALYPGGNTAVGAEGRIYVGWPVPAQLDADLAKGIWHVSIFPLPGVDRNTTRFPKVWQTTVAPSAALTLTDTSPVLGQDTVLPFYAAPQITVGGAIQAGEVAAVKADGTWYTYTVQSSDTLASVATAIAGLVSGATANGDTVVFENSTDITARVTTTGTSGMEVRRQQRVFRLTAWAPSHTLRDTIAGTLDAYLAPIERFALPDGFGARLLYSGTHQTDELQRQTIYRRDLDYSVEYATTQTRTDSTIEIPQISVEDRSGNVILTASP